VALNSVGNVCRYLIDFRTKILKIPPDFSKPVGKSVGNCVSDHACIGFSASVGDSVVKHADRPGSLTAARQECAPSVSDVVGKSVGDCGRGCNFFATLDKISMGHNPSVMVAKSCNCFATLDKISTGHNPSVYPSVLLSSFCMFCLYCLSILLHKRLNCNLIACTTQ